MRQSNKLDGIEADPLPMHHDGEFISDEVINKADHCLGKIPEHERFKLISSRAYSLYEKRGFIAGHDIEDWNKAASEIDKFFY